MYFIFGFFNGITPKILFRKLPPNLDITDLPPILSSCKSNYPKLTNVCFWMGKL